MIDKHQRTQLAARRIWSGYLDRLFERLDLAGCSEAPEVSESVAVFCQQHARLNTSGISLLAARSFCATGELRAAEKILNHDRTHRRYAARWLETLSSDYPFPELYPLFASRALRPAELVSMGEGNLWILDLSRIERNEAQAHEMLLFKTLRVLTEKMACLWKKTEGHGALGVKNLRLWTAFAPPALTGQLFTHLQDVLAYEAKSRGWTNTPAVSMIDL